MIKSLYIRFQIREYSRKLLYLLVRDVGIRNTYKITSVDKIIKKYSFNQKHAYLAYSMFVDKKMYEKAKVRNNIPYSIDEARRLIADVYFEGNMGFNRKDIFRISLYKDWKAFISGDLCVIDYMAYAAWKNHSSSQNIDTGSFFGDNSP